MEKGYLELEWKTQIKVISVTTKELTENYADCRNKKGNNSHTRCKPDSATRKMHYQTGSVKEIQYFSKEMKKLLTKKQGSKEAKLRKSS